MNNKKILVPVTLSDGSLSSVLVALPLAQELSATMVLFHVLPTGWTGEEGDALWRLRQLAERAHPQGPIEYVVSEGNVADKIVEQAETLNADAIVMSTHGEKGWFRWLHRQTARKVLRRASRPVWLVSPGGHRQPVMMRMLDSPQPAHASSVAHSLFAPLLAFFRQVWPIS